MRFYLGAHHPQWLERAPFPLFGSHRRLAARRRLARATIRWTLDSGGFSELRLHGGWRTRPEEYVAAVRRYRDEIGRLEWAAPMDWMCEPFMLAKTGLTVLEHKRRTVENYLELRDLAPDLPFVPALQDWGLDDYQRCATLYDEAGVGLATEPPVRVGSISRSQATGEIVAIVHSLASLGIRLHGFGVKACGLIRYADCLVSADSLAWSFEARRSAPLLGCRLPTARTACGTGVARADAGAARCGVEASFDGCVRANSPEASPK